MDSRNTSFGSCETWTSDSEATSTMTSSSGGFLNYIVEPEGRYVETANGKLLPVVGCGQLEIVAEKPGGLVSISLEKVLHMPKLERHIIYERQTSPMSGMLFVKSPTVAHLGTGNDVFCYFSYSLSLGLYEMTARRRKTTPERALAARTPPQRDIMEVHRLLAHPSEHITGATAKATGIIKTDEWRSFVECDQSKAHRHAVPRTTDNRASERAALLYVDLAGPMESESAGGSRYIIMIVDDFSRFKVRKFLKTKSSVETAAALECYVATYITPEQVSIRAVCTDHGAEFERAL